MWIFGESDISDWSINLRLAGGLFCLLTAAKHLKLTAAYRLWWATSQKAQRFEPHWRNKSWILLQSQTHSSSCPQQQLNNKMYNIEKKTQTGSVKEHDPAVESSHKNFPLFFKNQLMKPHHVAPGASKATLYALNIKNEWGWMRKSTNFLPFHYVLEMHSFGRMLMLLLHLCGTRSFR